MRRLIIWSESIMFKICSIAGRCFDASKWVDFMHQEFLTAIHPVQPCIGSWSDKCHSRFGRRRPFIFVGSLLICAAVILIGFSVDIGYALGDIKEDCSVYHGSRWKAAIVCVVGFWILDFGNNTVQCPTRALMADLSGHHGYNRANAIFCSWLAFGNILGYASGASGEWHRWFPFLQSKACCESCANLKGAFLVAVVFLILCMLVTITVAKEVPLSDARNSGFNASEDATIAESNLIATRNADAPSEGLIEIFKSFRHLPPGMPSVLLVESLTWLSWFPFFLYNTDWVGREVYHGNLNGTQAEVDAYNRGVRVGAFALLLNSIVLGVTSFMIEPMCRRLSARIVWAMSNFFLFVSMGAISIIGEWSLKDYLGGAQQEIEVDHRVKAAALVLFAALGFPLAVLFSVPSGFMAQLAANAGRGQGLYAGVLNISVVIPEVIIALSAGPWDALFNKGNLPAFALAASTALVASLVGLFILPNLSSGGFNPSGFSGGH